MKFDLVKSIEILERTPSVLLSLLKDLSVDWTHQNEGGETWSAFDIIGHLIHGEKTDWIPRTLIILDSQTGRAFDKFDRFAQFENSKGKSLKALLDEFSKLRMNNIEKLKSLNLDEEKLNLKGIHPELGEVNLKQLLATWVIHDLTHINQISRVMAMQYKNEIGPWKEFFSLMRDFKD